MNHYESGDGMHDLREKIIGLGDTSHRKSYYPQLREQIRVLNQALDALQESENKYRSLVENVNIGIVRSEPWKGGRLIQANPAFYRMLGFESEEELQNIPPEDLYLHPEDRNELLKELRETGKLRDRKIEFKVKGGTTVLCSATFSAQFDSSGNMIYLDSVIEDITEKERKAEALRQAHNKLNLLSSITRHDIINQVMVLEGYLQLVMEKAKDPEEIMLLERMKDNIISIDRHIMFTKDYQEIGIKSPEWVNLRDMLTRTMAPMDNILLNIKVDVHDYLVFSDPMISKVFYNLANNVIKHSKASKLTITTEFQDGQLLLVFQDNGIGIEDKKKLFKKGTSNSGYGLFLSKEILSITGIDIRETGVPGNGARFEIIFPPELYKTPV